MKLSQKIIGLLLAILVISSAANAKAKSYYKSASFWDDTITSNRSLFTMRPIETTSLQTIARFGPVGMGIDLVQPAFVMKIHNIEEGSPAEATGKLKAGDLIKPLAEIVGGRGGGRPELAQAGGPDGSKLDAALDAFYAEVEKQLG